MNKCLFCLLLICALGTLGVAGYSDGGPSLLAAGEMDDTSSGASAAPNPAPSDWAPPTKPQLGPGQDVDSEQMETDGTSSAPTIEWRPSADSSETDAASEAALAPRVELSGPGTPKWKVITYVSQKTTIDDNLYISNSQKQSDVYFSIAPGFAAGWGDFRSALLSRSNRFSDEYGKTREPVSDPLDGDFAYVNYTATATHYVSHDSLDAVDQDGAVSAQWDFTKVLVGLNARVQTLTGPDIDVGTRTRRTVFTIDATSTYTLSDKTTFDLDAGGSVHDYVTELSSSEWHAQIFADYQMFPKTSVGAGVNAGIRTLQTSPDQYYEQGLLRANYNASAKLSIHLSGGLEVDESQGPTKLNPIFSLGATYMINDVDSLTVDASRSTSSSAVTSGETIESTGVDLQVRHRIYSNFSIACSFSYGHSDYYADGLSTKVRSDDYIFVRPSLAYDFAQWSQVELAYEYHRDLSTVLASDFGENIGSLQFNFVF